MDFFKYKVYGLTLLSEIFLPDLLPDSSEDIDVEIRFGNVPQHLRSVRAKGILFEANENDFIFQYDPIGKFRVQNGNSIIIQPRTDATINEISLFLLGSVMGALIHQRGLLPLHGSSFILDDKAIIITGLSSAGKSTLAAGLYESGYPILTDDISTISVNSNGSHLVHRGYPIIRLWKDVLQELRINEPLTKVRPQLEKYKRPIKFGNIDDKYSVGLIINIATKNTPGYSFKKVLGVDKFNLLKTNTYRYNFIEGLNKVEHHFRSISNLSSNISVYRSERPTSPISICEFVNFIESKVKSVLK